jgi:predicted permease
MERLLQDVRLGLRTLRHASGFAMTAILTLGLGIGLATAVFTVADALLLRRLPVVDQDRVVVLFGEAPDGSIDNVPLKLEDAREFARRTAALSRAAFFLYNGAAPITVREGGRISRLQRALVSGDYFAVLGARPLIGRVLRAEDDAAGAAPVLVLSHRAWQRRFGGAPDVLGRRIVMHEDGVAYTIVGVMPPGLDYPRGTDAWVPVLAAIPERAIGLLDFDVIGRLAPEATPSVARNEMTGYFSHHFTSAWLRNVRGVVNTLPNLALGDTRPAVLAFAAAAALLLLITCINVANLLLVRGLARGREIAVRSALGASRRRIVVQLLAEHAPLAIAGGALGVAVAAAAVRGFVAFAPAGLPRLEEIQLNGTALVAALGITTMATLLFAVAPAILTSRVEAHEVLRSGTRQSATRRSRLVTEALVAGQVALALLVLSAAGLIGRSLIKLERADLAFDPSRLMVAELAFGAERYDTGPKQGALLERVLPVIQAVPGVQAVSPVVAVPYASTRSWEGRPAVEGQSEQEAATNPMIDFEVVAPSFFGTLGLPVTRGRAFTDADRAGAPAVVVLSQSAARRYWPNGDPVGKHVLLGAPSEHPPLATVVGIVPDTRYRDLREPHATIYFPLRQSFFPFAPTTLVIRTGRTASDFAASLRRAVAETAPDVAVASVAPFEALLAAPLAQPRMNALLLAVFAAAAVALAGVGLFGILATMVHQRMRELGVRMALGASGANVARLVLTRGLALAGVGMAVGLVGALAANRLLAALLFQVTPTDPVTLSLVAVAIIAVATLASIVPVRSSTRIDPAIALRAE